MKTGEIVARTSPTSTKIVRQIIDSAANTYIPEDVERAVSQAIDKFYLQMKEAARQELKFRMMQNANEIRP